MLTKQQISSLSFTNLGQPVSNARLSHLVLEATQQTYKKAGRPVPERVHAFEMGPHSLIGFMTRCPSIRDMYGGLLVDPLVDHVHLFQVVFMNVAASIPFTERVLGSV